MIRRILLVLLLLSLLAAGFLVWAIGVPYAGYEREVFVDIPPGAGTAGMARMLAGAHVVRSEWQFLLVRALYPRATLQAGEYKFDKAMTPLQVFRKIAAGDIFYHVVVIPEGSNMFDIADTLQRMGLMKAAEFLAVARESSLIKDLAPAAPSLEGFLFPSTYRLTRRTRPQQLAREMTNQFRKVWRQHAAPGVDVNRTVTMASLVEKETGVPGERRTVASVYTNRLKAGIKLECDPTTIYAALLQGRYRGTIYRSDLDNPHPYNTYRNPGLPPGPIANPGVESLKAALDPAETSYLFFVAKGDNSGAHIFSETLEQHNAAVRDYRNAIAQ